MLQIRREAQPSFALKRSDSRKTTLPAGKALWVMGLRQIDLTVGGKACRFQAADSLERRGTNGPFLPIQSCDGDIEWLAR
jgi:hypothetical protein